MKNRILLFAAIIFSGAIFAQNRASFGIRAGLTFSGMQGDAVKTLDGLVDLTDGILKTTSKQGLFAGAFANIPVGKIVSIEPGLFYSQKGYELTGGFNIKGISVPLITAKTQIETKYIDIPLMLKANLGKLQLFAGPQASYLLNADLVAKAGVAGINLLNETIDATSQFNRWDMGLVGGIGFQVSKNLSLNASYERGLNKLDANKASETYNKSIKVGIGLSF